MICPCPRPHCCCPELSPTVFATTMLDVTLHAVGCARRCRSPLGLMAGSAALDEVPMRRHGFDTILHRRPELREPSLDLVRLECVDQRVIAARDDVLTHHDGEPAGRGEEIAFLAQDAAMAAKEVDLLA